LFLDEIGDLPLQLQPKLLRVLQEQEFERVGSARKIRVNVRIIAATNLDLAEMVEDRRFRADLFYRPNVFPISLPPLRQRPRDIPELVRHFVREFAASMKKEITAISDEIMGIIRLHDWPDNVRELRNDVDRAVIMSTGSVLWPPINHLKLRERDEPGAGCTLEEADRTHILDVLKQVNWIGGGRGAQPRDSAYQVPH
jgi:formate hydrogenlyase transcriptional activator